MSQWLLITAWILAIIWPFILMVALWRGLKRGRGPKAAGWSLVVLFSLSWAVGVRAFLWEPEALRVRRIDVFSPNWTGLPLKAGVISDIHLGEAHMSPGRLSSIVEQMNVEEPDIILLLGDFIAEERDVSPLNAGGGEALIAGLSALGRLHAPLGVWAVLGHADWRRNSPGVDLEQSSPVRPVLASQGIRTLENQRVLISRTGGGFWLGGLADYDSREALPSYGDMLKGLPGNAPVIAMSHRPDVFALAPPRVLITFAGHTHCGQVNLPFLGRLMTTSPASEKWPCGLYDESGRKLYVTGGVGISSFPARLNQPPEIGVVTLRSG